MPDIYQRIEDYWDERPCNVRHSMADVDVSPWLYSRNVTRRKWKVEPHIPRFAKYPRWRDKCVLDLGCGIGTDTLAFARYGAWVTAADISWNSLDIAKKRAKAEGLDHIMFHQGNMEDWNPWEYSTYDLVWAFGSIHHTPCPSRAIRRVRQCIAPTGEFRLMLYHRLSSKPISLWLRYGLPRDFDSAVSRGSEAQSGCPVTHTYTRRSARRLLEDNGFTVREMFVDHIFPYRVPDYINYRYVKKLWVRLLPPRIFRWMETHYGWHLCIVATPN